MKSRRSSVPYQARYTLLMFFRLVAYKLSSEGYMEYTISLLEQVLATRPEHPQSARDLALALSLHFETLASRQSTNCDEVIYFCFLSIWNLITIFQLLNLMK